MVVRLAFMAFVDMVVRTVFSAVDMVVDAFPRAVLMGVLVFVGVLMIVDMGMFMTVPPDPRMFVLMFVFMGMLMGMVMMVFVVAFHGRLLFAQRITHFRSLPRRHGNFPFRTASTPYCRPSLSQRTKRLPVRGLGSSFCHH